MQQAQIYFGSDYTCRYLGHNDQDIIGFCLIQECKDPYDFCIRCSFEQQCHEGHQDNKCLKGFKDLFEMLDESIKKLELEEEGFKELHQLINESQNYIDKQMFDKIENNIQKLQKIKKKIELLLKPIFQLKSLFIQSKESLQQKNYHFFTNNIKQLKKGLLPHLNLKIIEIIASIKKHKQVKPFQNLKNASLRSQNEKLTQMYFLKIIDSCNSLGFNNFPNFLRIDVQLETKSYFDKIIISNPQLTLAQICKLFQLRNIIEALERLYNASKFDDKNNRVHHYDLINQEQSLNNENFMIISQVQNVINFLNKLTLSKPNNELFSFIIDKFLEVQSNWESSIKFIEELIQSNPQNANLYNKKGIVLYQFDKFQNSTEQFDQAIKLSPNNSIYYINKGISLIQLGDYDDSVIHFNQAKILEAINLQVINQYTQRINSQIRNDNTIYQFPLKLDKYNLLKQDDTDGYLKQGNDLQNKGDYLNAILCYDVTIRLKPDYAKAYNDKGYSLHQLQKYEKAIQCYEQAIKLEANNAQYYNNKGKSLKRLSKYQDAVQCYNEAIRLKPDCADFYNNKGLCLQELEQPDEAIKCYDEAIRLNPEFADYYNNEGKSLEKIQQYQDSLKCYDQAKRLTQNNNKGQCCNVNNELHLKDVNFSTIIAETLLELSKLQKETICHEDEIKLPSDHQPNDADYYYNKGLALHQLQKYKDAIICYDEAIRQNPNNANYYNNKGMALANLQGDYEAIKYFDQAIKLNEEMKLQHNNKKNYENKKNKNLIYLIQDSNLCNKLGQILNSQKKYQNAIKYYEMAIRLQSDNAEAFYYKGCSLSELQQYQYAISCFDDAIRLQPNDADFYYNKGLALQELKQYQSAINCLNESIRLKPADVNYQNKKGNILKQLQQNENTTNCSDNAIRFNPNDSNFQNNKCNILHEELQQNQHAIKCSDEVIRLGGENHNSKESGYFGEAVETWVQEFPLNNEEQLEEELYQYDEGYKIFEVGECNNNQENGIIYKQVEQYEQMLLQPQKKLNESSRPQLIQYDIDKFWTGI